MKNNIILPVLSLVIIITDVVGFILIAVKLRKNKDKSVESINLTSKINYIGISFLIALVLMLIYTVLRFCL